MAKTPVNEHLRRTHPTFVVFCQKAPLHSTAAKGSSANRSRTIMRPRISPRSPEQSVTSHVNSPTESTPALLTPGRHILTSGRKTVSLCAKLATNNFRILGPSSSTGISDRMDQVSISSVSSNYLRDIQGGLPAGGGRSREPSPKTGSGGGFPAQGPVYQSSLFGKEEGCIIPPGNQPKATEHFHQEGTLQDGRCQYDQGSSAARGLDVLPGPQGRIFDSANCQRTPQVPPFSVGW